MLTLLFIIPCLLLNSILCLGVMQFYVSCNNSIQWRHHREGEGAADPPDSRFVTYGAPVHQMVNIYRPVHNLQNYANIFILAIHY